VESITVNRQKATRGRKDSKGWDLTGEHGRKLEDLSATASPDVSSRGGGKREGEGRQGEKRGKLKGTVLGKTKPHVKS